MLEEKDKHIEKTGPKEIGWFIALWALGFCDHPDCWRIDQTGFGNLA